MTTITQPQIDQVNALYKDPETGKGILEGWTAENRWLYYAGVAYGPSSDANETITSLVHKLLEQEQKSGYINADYLRTAIRDRMRTALADTRIHNDAIEAYREVARCIDYLAPPPVVEPEPMDEFEKWLEARRSRGMTIGFGDALAKYRELKQQSKEQA